MAAAVSLRMDDAVSVGGVAVSVVGLDVGVAGGLIAITSAGRGGRQAELVYFFYFF